MKKTILFTLIYTFLLGCKETGSDLKTLDNFTRMDGETLRLYACEGDQESFGSDRFMGREIFTINDAITKHRDIITKSFDRGMTSIPEVLQEAYFTLQGMIEVVPNGWCFENMGNTLHQTEKKYFSERDTNAGGVLNIRTCAKQSFGNNMMANTHTQYIEVGDMSRGSRADLLPELRHNIVRAFGYILATRLSHIYMTSGNALKYIGAREAPSFMEARIELVAALLTDLSLVEKEKETGEPSRYGYDVTVTSYMPCEKVGNELKCHNETDKNTPVHRMLSDMFNISGSTEGRIPLRKQKIREIVAACSDASFASSQCLTFMRFLDYILAESFDSFYCTIDDRNSVNNLPSSRKIMKEDFPLTFERFLDLNAHLTIDDGKENLKSGFQLAEVPRDMWCTRNGGCRKKPSWLNKLVGAVELVTSTAMMAIPGEQEAVFEMGGEAIALLRNSASVAEEATAVGSEVVQTASGAAQTSGSIASNEPWITKIIQQAPTKKVPVVRGDTVYEVELDQAWSSNERLSAEDNLSNHWAKHGFDKKEDFAQLGITTEQQYQQVALNMKNSPTATEYIGDKGTVYYDADNELFAAYTDEGLPKTMYRLRKGKWANRIKRDNLSPVSRARPGAPTN